MALLVSHCFDRNAGPRTPPGLFYGVRSETNSSNAARKVQNSLHLTNTRIKIQEIIRFVIDCCWAKAAARILPLAVVRGQNIFLPAFSVKRLPAKIKICL